MDPLRPLFRAASTAIKLPLQAAVLPLKAVWNPLYKHVLDPQSAIEGGWNCAHDKPALSPEKKKELMEASSLETPRSLTRSLWGILSPYWTKSGPKEILTASALLATSLYMTWYAVQMTVDFSQWLGQVTDTLVSQGNSQSELRPEIIQEMLTQFPGVGEVLERYPNLQDIMVKYPDAMAIFNGTEMGAINLTNLNEVIADYPEVEALLNENPMLQDFIAQPIRALWQDPQARAFLSSPENSAFFTLLQSNPTPSVIFENIPAIAEQIQNNSELASQVSAFSEAYNAHEAEWREILTTNPSLEEIFRNYPGLEDEIRDNPEILNEITSFKNELGQRLQESDEISSDYRTIGSLFGSDFFNNWGNAFTTWKKDAFQQAWHAKDFATIALKFSGMAVIAFKAKQYLAMRWRAWSTGYYANKWMNNKAFQRIKNQFNNVDNPDQRLQEDPAIFTTAAISISTGLMSAGMTFASYARELWDMGSLNLMVYGGPDVEIPGAMMLFAVGYAAAITGITAALGWKLPLITRAQQQLEGNFRSSMKLAHEFADNIALEEGEHLQLDTIKKNFKPVMQNSVRDLNVNTKLIVADQIFGNFAFTVPKLIGSGLIGAGQMTVGGMNVMGNYFGRITGSLSFITNRWNQLTQIKATADRIYMMDRALEAAHYLETEKEYYADIETQKYLEDKPQTSAPAPGVM